MTSPLRRLLLLVSLAMLALSVPAVRQRGTKEQPPAALRAAQRLASMQVPFISNEGSPNSHVSFYASTFAGTALVTRSAELVYALANRERGEPGEHGALTSVILTESFVGGRVPVPRAGLRSPTTVNIFRGNDPLAWRRDLPTYESVMLDAVYDGVDIELKSFGRSIEKVFTVHPDAAPGDIRVRVQGGEGLRIADGSLQVSTVHGPVTFSRPIAFQETGRARTPVEVAYEVDGDTYGFRLGHYDRTLPLVIDPVIAATYVGGTGAEIVTGLVTDSANNVYAAGKVTDLLNDFDFPGIGPGSADLIHPHNDTEGFVVKLDADLKTILAATYLGGGSDDLVQALAIDSSDTLYLGGATWSSDLPGISAISADSVLAGASDAFVTRLDPTLSGAPVSTFLGGTGVQNTANAGEMIYAIVVDAAGDIVVAGYTHSADFPGITPRSPDDEYEGFNEAIVARLDPSLSVAPISTFLGGEDCEAAFAVAIDPEDGAVYVGGFTRSVDFPFVSNASADHTFEGDSEAWMARLDPSLAGSAAATYLGGTENFDREIVTSIATAPGVTVYAAGTTFAEDFPGLELGDSADADAHDGEGFVVGLSKTLEGVQRTTFLGGNTFDYINSIVLVGDVVWVAGSTMSFSEFPQANDGSYHGCGSGQDYEAFVASLEFLRELLTFKCLSRDSEGTAVASAGSAIYVGGVSIGTMPVVTADAADPTGVPLEGFVVELGTSGAMGFFAHVSLLADLLIPQCECPDRVKDHLTQKVIQAANHAHKSHPEAAAHALQQFIAIVEREFALESRRTRSEEQARRFIAVAELALADLPPPRAAGDRRRFDRRYLARLKAVSRDCACQSATVMRFRAGLDAARLPSCQACQQGTCAVPTNPGRARVTPSP